MLRRAIPSITLLFETIPGLKNQSAGSIFPEFSFLFFFQDAEGFAGEIGAINVFGVKNVTELLSGKAIELG
jgi:hypothetical protein